MTADGLGGQLSKREIRWLPLGGRVYPAGGTIMADKMTVLVGTVGQGVFRSADGGETWQSVGINQGLHLDALVRTLVHSPRQPEVVYAGTDKELYCSLNAGLNWEWVDSPLSNYEVWNLAIDPVEPNVMCAGTGTPTPAEIFRSTDAGQT